MKKNIGFTLIELVIVIIVLGLLAATAVPKFISLQSDAKTSVIDGTESALHSAAKIVYSKSLIAGIENNSHAIIGGIQVSEGYPSATAKALSSSTQLTDVTFSDRTEQTTSSPGFISLWITNSLNGATCLVYTKLTGLINSLILFNEKHLIPLIRQTFVIRNIKSPA